MNLTPEDRRARPPWLDLDVPEDELIYRKGLGGKPLSQSLPMDEFPKFSETASTLIVYELIPNGTPEFTVVVTVAISNVAVAPEPVVCVTVPVEVSTIASSRNVGVAVSSIMVYLKNPE